MRDFPAAHSMDTAWFAIDNDGNVALFETGESGCVPEAAYNDDADELQREVRALPANGFKFDPHGYRETQWSEHVVLDEDLTPDAQLYMFLSDLVPVQDLLSRLAPEEMGATTCKAVRITAIDPAALAELHARDACLGCYRERGEGPADELAAHGIYRYEHTCENWIAGPYARTTVPVRPLTIDEVPQAIRNSAVAYDGRFAETPLLQPAEHWPCSSWEAGWLSSDRKTARPFPEHEEAWDEYADERGQDNDGVKFLDEPLDPPRAPKLRWWK